MHGNANLTEEKHDKIDSKIRMFRGYLNKPSYLTKITLKKPLSRGSRFKIYFRLERRGNRGSRLNFHRIPFFQKPRINKPETFRIMPINTHILN